MCGIDGGTRTFTQNDSGLVFRTLTRLNPPRLFAADTVKIIDDDSETEFVTSTLARIDFLTDRLSVWDFPFVLGAHVELTETEYCEALDEAQMSKSPDSRSDVPVFVEIGMLKDHRYFFWMEIAGGLSAFRMSRIQSMLHERSLIFGLRTGGIGVLNLANMVNFAIFPEPPDAMEVGSIRAFRERGNEI